MWKGSVATVAPGSGTPTGLVVVSDGVDSCTASVAVGRCNVSLTTIGARTLTAGYLGTTGFKSSTSADEAHTVNRIATVTAMHRWCADAR